MMECIRQPSRMLSAPGNPYVLIAGVVVCGKLKRNHYTYGASGSNGRRSQTAVSKCTTSHAHHLKRRKWGKKGIEPLSLSGSAFCPGT